jgi:glutamyl-tRNA synthetase
MLHLGGARTALFNWLFARSRGGTFILRIEDTDRARFDPAALDDITRSLDWLGLDWDEGPGKDGDFGPYFQSERREFYRSFADRLVEEGHAYRCYCTPEDLEEMRIRQKETGSQPGYDRRCRDLDPADHEKYTTAGTPYVIRFKMPLDGSTEFTDTVRGKISYPNQQQTDFVIMKSDGYPTYHLACVVDDHHMDISHVLRGDEWIPSTPKHVCLYVAFGWEPPVFAHLPVILAPGGGKLSKRHGAASVYEYREMGYLPDAMVNFLALLGWSVSTDNEVVPRDQLIKEFTLEQINKTGAQFDQEKLKWMNGAYIRELPVERLTELVLPRFTEAGLTEAVGQPDKLAFVMSLLQPRLQLLSDAVDSAWYFFSDDITYDEKAVNKFIRKEGVQQNLQALYSLFAEAETFDAGTTEAIVTDYLETSEQPLKKVVHPLRVAVTGRSFSPGIFDTLAGIGRDRVLKRIDYCINHFFTDTE